MKPHSFPFTKLFAQDLGVDLGTTNTRVCVPGEGIVVNEPTLVLVRHGPRGSVPDGRAVGHLAEMKYGRTEERIDPVCPMRDGSVADVELCGAMLREFLRKAARRGWGARPRVLMAVPSDCTSVQLGAMLRSAVRAGARQVYLMDKPKAAALGAGLPVGEPIVSMICDIGGGSTEIAVLCLGEVSLSEWLHVGGGRLDSAVADYLMRKLSLRISRRMAEGLKMHIGSAVELEPERTMEVPGCDATTGLPRKAVIGSTQVYEALREPLRAIVAGVERTLARCHPEMIGDLMQGGLVLTGGGAMLHGLDSLMAEATGMPLRVVEEPRTCVARGLATCLSNLDVWHTLIRRHEAA